MAHVNFFVHYGNSVAFMLLLHGQTRILQLSIWSSLPKKVTEANIRENSLIVFNLSVICNNIGNCD